jgi:hypothetical protein
LAHLAATERALGGVEVNEYFDGGGGGVVFGGGVVRGGGVVGGIPLPFAVGLDRDRTSAREAFLATIEGGGADWVKAESRALAVPTVRRTVIRSVS